MGAGCGPDGAAGGGGSGAGGGGGEGGSAPIVTVLHPDREPLPGQTECTVTISKNLPFEGHTHVPVCTPVEYGTNPPSSGNHWPIWAEFRTFDAPVPREMLVHNLEHGAVVMRYRCDDGCPDVVDAFEQASADFGADELCLLSPENADRSRIVIAPDPKLDAPIGLSAWQATYTATCLDPESIQDFIESTYGKGPESLCKQGKDPADPSTGVPACGS